MNSDQEGDNSQGVVTTCASHTEELEWDVFDALSVRFKHLFYESVLNWCCLCSPTYDYEELVSDLRISDQFEIKEFSEEYRQKYGRPTPHVAAKANMQRYGRHKSRKLKRVCK